MILDEDSLEGEIRGLGFTNLDDWTIGDATGLLLLVFLDDPISNLLMSRSHSGFEVRDLERFEFEVSSILVLGL